jgi:hypothetical protein
MYKGYIRVLDSPAFLKACKIVSEMENDNKMKSYDEINDMLKEYQEQIKTPDGIDRTAVEIVAILKWILNK